MTNISFYYSTCFIRWVSGKFFFTPLSQKHQTEHAFIFRRLSLKCVPLFGVLCAFSLIFMHKRITVSPRLIFFSFVFACLCVNDLLLRFLTVLKQIIGEDKQLCCEPKTEGDICYLTKQMKSLRQIHNTHSLSVIQSANTPWRTRQNRRHAGGTLTFNNVFSFGP